MRILALVTDAFDGYGGIAQYNRDLFDAFAETCCNKQDVTIVVQPRIADSKAPIKYGAILQERPIYNKFLYALRALFLAYKHRPDIIFCGHVYHGPLARLAARIVGARLISQLHGSEVWEQLPSRLLAPLLHSDMVLCVSRDTKARYEKQLAEAGNAFVLANTVGARFTPGDRASARQAFNVDDQEFVLLTVARLDGRGGYKGHDRVIMALPRLTGPQGQRIVYLVAGAGDDRPRLEHLAKSLDVSSQVRFLGKVPDAVLPDLYRAADLFVLPSTGEGFGIVYLEAMACGTPAIGLAIGGVTDALGDGELGTLVEPGADLVSAMQMSISAAQPDRCQLSGAMLARFGKTAFNFRVLNLIDQINTTGIPGRNPLLSVLV